MVNCSFNDFESLLMDGVWNFFFHMNVAVIGRGSRVASRQYKGINNIPGFEHKWDCSLSVV